MSVVLANGDNDTSSIASRTLLSFDSSIKTAHGKWVRQPQQEIGLLMALANDTMRDLYWCAVLKFQRELLLATPSDAVMTAMLEPMCHLEEVLKIGSTIEEVDERREIYGHHREKVHFGVCVCVCVCACEVVCVCVCATTAATD
jgi:hypothetical protein